MSSILPPYLTYYQVYGLIICSTHQIALHETKILDHIIKDHHDTTIRLCDLDDIGLVTLETAHHMITSDQPITPIPTLQDPQPGFQCKRCGLVRRSQRRIRDHLYQDHHIQGYQAQDKEATSCLVQALVGSAYLFTVTQQPLSPPSLPTRKRSRELSVASASLGPTTQRSRLSTLSQSCLPDPTTFIASLQAQRQTLRASRVIHTTSETYKARGFFTDSQYPSFLDSRDAKDLEALFTLEDPNQTTWLTSIIYRLLSQGSSLIPSTNTQSLGAVNSFSQDPIYQATLRPLRPLQSQASMQRYCLVFQAFISFLIRSYSLLDASSSGPSSYLALYTLSPSQLNALQALETFLSSLPTPDISDTPPTSKRLVIYISLSIYLSYLYTNIYILIRAFMSESDESASDIDSEDDALSSLGQTTLDSPTVDKGVGLLMQLLLGLAECCIMHQQDIPLYAFLACYSRNYTHDCFKPLEQITLAYSAIIKGHQFVFLYWLHTVQFATPTQGESMATFIKGWMHKYCTAQSESPLGHVLVLRALAFAIMKSSTSLGKIHIVTPNTLRYRQVTVSQQDLRVLVTKGLAHLALGLSNELFLEFAYFQEVSFEYINQSYTLLYLLI